MSAEYDQGLASTPLAEDRPVDRLVPRPLPRDCYYEPPFPGFETVLICWSAPSPHVWPSSDQAVQHRIPSPDLGVCRIL